MNKAIQPYIDNVMALGEQGIRLELDRLHKKIERARQSSTPGGRTYKILTEEDR